MCVCEDTGTSSMLKDIQTRIKKKSDSHVVMTGQHWCNLYDVESQNLQGIFGLTTQSTFLFRRTAFSSQIKSKVDHVRPHLRQDRNTTDYVEHRWDTYSF